MSTKTSSPTKSTLPPEKTAGKPEPKRGKVLQLDAALARNTAAQVKRGGFSPVAKGIEQIEEGDELVWADVDVCDDSPYQYRIDYVTDMDILVNQVNADGQLQPCPARPHPERAGRFQFIAGHRRKYAVKEGADVKDELTGQVRRIFANAGSKQPNPGDYVGKILLLVKKRRISDMEMRRMAYSENSGRLDPNPIEDAEFFKETQIALTQDLRDRGLLSDKKEASWAKVADFLNAGSKTQVHRTVQLLELPKAWVEQLRSGELNERHGRALLSLREFPQLQRTLYRNIRQQKWTGNEAERKAEAELTAIKQPTLADAAAAVTTTTTTPAANSTTPAPAGAAAAPQLSLVASPASPSTGPAPSATPVPEAEVSSRAVTLGVSAGASVVVSTDGAPPTEPAPEGTKWVPAPVAGTPEDWNMALLPSPVPGQDAEIQIIIADECLEKAVKLLQNETREMAPRRLDALRHELANILRRQQACLQALEAHVK